MKVTFTDVYLFLFVSFLSLSKKYFKDLKNKEETPCFGNHKLTLRLIFVTQERERQLLTICSEINIR